MIHASAAEVSNGVRLVRDTGETLKVIGQHVIAINCELDAIATSAREQATGLAEVNTAVNQMDQVTQQNAAMVEESTAASAALASESARMQSLVGQFQLAHVGGRSVRSISAAQASPEADRAARTFGSPARSMLSKVARAVGMPSSDTGSWQEF